jgi:hypothetical protein
MALLWAVVLSEKVAVNTACTVSLAKVPANVARGLEHENRRAE